MCWPQPQITKVIDNEIRIVNNTENPIYIPKNEHLCQIRPSQNIDLAKIKNTKSDFKPVVNRSNSILHSDSIQIDKQLSAEWVGAFRHLHQNFDLVFESTIGRYNGFSGKLKARILFGSTVPPPRKLHAPTYGRDNLQLLQDKFDELESQGVFGRPEDYGVVVEHVSPSFLVKKPSGGYRLVTAFTALSGFTKTLPTLMPTVEDMLRTISEWKYLISSDLKDAFYQIPMAKESMKWCGTVTPFRGIRIYLVACQGLPGSSEWLEELLCLLIGEKVREGSAAKVADDLFIGGQTIKELFKNWSEVLDILAKNGLKLKPPKTFIAPTHAQLLGWDWNNGCIKASSHKLLPLTKCDPPPTVTAVRSYVGAYKFFNRVIRGCAQNLDHLEKAIVGKQKSDKITWTDDLLDKFRASQKALESAAIITLPKRSDPLTIVHDGSQKGIGSVMYVNREKDIKLGGFFSAKLKTHQARWYPCEIEALSIAVSVTHFAPYIRDSLHCTQILTDNRPCVQAWSKMRRGEFSTSARVATFMSSLSEFNVEVQHISGSYNIPSDFLSRNPLICDSQNCQLCRFVSDSETTVVRGISAKEVLNGHVAVPFSNRVAWKNLQMECPDLRRVHAHLTNGTRPTAKNTKVGVVKKFLRNSTVARDGLLVVKQSQPFLPELELIVVPLRLLHGLITSLHIMLSHPTAHQLTNVFNRCYYSLKVSDCVSSVVKSCSQCQALETIPTEMIVQSSSVPATSPLLVYAADVLRRCRQFIFVLRDTFSSFTVAQIYNDENHNTLRTALIVSISSIRPNPQTSVEVRVDNAPGFKPLKSDFELAESKIVLDFGRVHNKNKNPVAEKSVRELSSEILRVLPEGGQINKSQLAVVVNQLNSRIRNRGLSAWEILNQRNQFTGEQLDFSDLHLSEEQAQQRATNQQASAKFKARGKPPAENASVEVGSLVYIKSEGEKHKARERYLVTEVNNDSCTLQKFVKSQLRSQKYSLKLSEVYPVRPEQIVLPGRIRDLDGDREDEDEEEGDRTHLVPASAPPIDSIDVPIDVPMPELPRVEIPDSRPCDPQIECPEELSNRHLVEPIGNTPLPRTPRVDSVEELPSRDPPVDSMNVGLGARRSKRSTTKPRWMLSGDYVVDDEG